MFSATKGGSPSGYQISRSVRLRSSATAYFNRTLTTPTSATTYTWSGWVKRGTLGVESQLFSAGAAVSDQIFFQNSTDVLIVYLGANTLITSQVFRDPSSWYHIVLQVDTTQATASNRVRLYVNGIQVTAFSTTNYPALNATTKFNSAAVHNIGRYQAGASGYFDGYLTEVNFIDGQALTPSSFGETNTVTGVWQPKKYAGTYGTNGFYLNFSDNSAATAAAIGKDYSGNGNNWTPNNISVTAGVTYDSMLDVPTLWADGGNGRGNYATLNPLSKGSNATLSQGNLRFDDPSASTNCVAYSTIGVTSGKWYCEFNIVGTDCMVGLSSSQSTTISYIGADAGSWGYYSVTGNKWNNNASTAYGATYTANDVIGIAFDADAGTLTFYKNNVSQGVAYSGLTGATYFFGTGNGAVATNNSVDANFGQRPFAYTPPSGFKALNTLNLPTPTILKGNQYFDATLYSGNNANPRSITGLSFQPDLVWVKQRTANGGGFTAHQLYDAVRGTQNLLRSNTTDAELSNPANGGVQSFNADGFTIQGSSASINMNNTGETYVGWQWKEGATQGFDIVTYTGNGANRTIAHNLGVAPNFIILKCRSNATNWFVGGSNIAAAGNGTWSSVMEGLNTTSAVNTGATAVFNSTAPTSSVFSLGTELNANGSGRTFVAYLFAAIAGYSAFGRYTGNGSADGPFVFCGFRPRWIMFKRTDAISDWMIVDTARSTINVMTAALYADLSQQEDSGASVDVTANGFKLRSAATPANATNGSTHIFAAFAENPFKNSLAR